MALMLSRMVPPEVLLKGFGMEDAHAVVNSLNWGLDG
jgi:hypothetical protein